MRISDRAERKELNGEHPKMYPLELYPGPRSRVLGPARLVMMMAVMMMMTVMVMMVKMMMMNNGRQEGRWSPFGPCVN